jgi:aryl-alcohol dehydrogenase-like predicted oxidoreductase
MKYNQLGRTGLFVSEICLGAMTFGGNAEDGRWSAIAGLGQAEVDAIVGRSIAAGVNFFDTADVYSLGASERLLGQAFKNLKVARKDVVIATKVFGEMGPGPNDRGASRGHIMDSVQGSLERLQTDHIDLYQIHGNDTVTPIDETLRALDDLVHAGKVRYIGTSMFAGWQLIESLWVAKELGLNRFVSEQPAFHLLDRTAEREVIPAARSFGLAVIPWGPLCGGLLTGKYQRDGGGEAGRWSDGKDNVGREATPLAWDTIDLVKQLAVEKGCSPSQVALAWCGAQPGVTAPIIGPRTYEQVVDNLGAVDVVLTEEDFERVDALVPPNGVAVRYYDRANGLDLRPHLQRLV